jgi:hypothetical protein
MGKEPANFVSSPPTMGKNWWIGNQHGRNASTTIAVKPGNARHGLCGFQHVSHIAPFYDIARSGPSSNATMDVPTVENPEARLKAALDAFESDLLRPVVSGDFARWVHELKRSWDDAVEQICVHATVLHPQQYDQISKQDLELLPRIDLLKAEDVAIEYDCEKLNQAIGRLAQHAPKLEPDEVKGQKHAKGVVDAATTLIARVRKQTLAVQTWYIEAFNRDGGAVD